VIVSRDGRPFARFPLDVPLKWRDPRPELTLSCDPRELTDEQRLDWGHVALVIRPTSDE
jgi:hypothetical protein